MNSITKNDLTFQNFTFNPIVENGQVWLTSTELTKVLEYKKTDAVSQIYSRNSDEFTDSMTMTLNLSVNGINNSLRNKVVRVYSLRGAHLIAMFASTPVAKEFRKWVLDILDREVTKKGLNESLLFNNLKTANNNSRRILELWRKNLAPAVMSINNSMGHEIHELLISINGPIYGCLLHMESNGKNKGVVH
ncbi:BRO-N domain-containing protein [Proteus terrae]|uniref:BRO-N domain-containing protein n=1 Tax=Proteus terrae TaxID=1574161 RepID=UPI00301CAD51